MLKDESKHLLKRMKNAQVPSLITKRTIGIVLPQLDRSETRNLYAVSANRRV